MFREATEQELSALLELERSANLAALGHVFPPDRYPFPDSDVLARWRLVLDDPAVSVLVAEDPEGPPGLIAFTAYDEATVRHLAVRPDRWGQGLASAGLAIALDAMRLRGVGTASLWCLAENRRARRLYEHLGWRATDDRQECPWPPHPTEMRYLRATR